MLYDLKKIENQDVVEKKIVLRADVDVPLENNLIQDESRLNAWLPTLKLLLEKGSSVFIIGHLGRPKTQFSIHDTQVIVDEKYSLKPVASWIANKLGSNPEEQKINEFNGWKIADKVFLLENLRFYKEEEENNAEFSQKLANLADYYVNDAFASAHRAHASTQGITNFLPSYAGLRVVKEVEELTKVLEAPERPLAVIIGGAKIETKLPLVEKMHKFADFVLVGGEIAENDKVLLNVAHKQVLERKSVLLVADLGEELKDITPKSAENFMQILNTVKTVVWNGPMGLVEKEPYDLGTKTLAQGLSSLHCYKILGGGDTVSCIQKMGLLDKFNFVSIGGGAMLELLAGDRLPGLVALENKA